MIRASMSGFGALPAILVTAVITMVKLRYTDGQIARQLGEQYEEMQRLSEAQITELALLLSQQTDIPSWRWFSTLRDAREIGLFQKKSGNGTPSPPPPTDNTALWIGIGMGALVLIVALR